MDRRGFLRMLGLGAAAASTPQILCYKASAWTHDYDAAKDPEAVKARMKQLANDINELTAKLVGLGLFT